MRGLVSTRLRRWYPLHRRQRAMAPAVAVFHGLAFLRGGITAWAPRSAMRDVHRKGLLATTERAAIRHLPVKADQPQQAFDEPGRLLTRHPEQDSTMSSTSASGSGPGGGSSRPPRPVSGRRGQAHRRLGSPKPSRICASSMMPCCIASRNARVPSGRTSSPNAPPIRLHPRRNLGAAPGICCRVFYTAAAAGRATS